MNAPSLPASSPRRQALAAVLLGWMAGTVLQLQQPQLWRWSAYMAFMLLAPVVYAWGASKNIAIWQRWLLTFLAFAVLGAGLTGVRACLYQARALDPVLEGRDLRVTATVAGMPQRQESGLRLRLAVESAQTTDGQPVRVPTRVDVSWYGGPYAAAAMPVADADGAGVPALGLNRLPADVQAGERWTFTLRLKAPHGGLNPHGFDYELWLWEQGVGATGYVRASARDAAPQRLEQTATYPLAWLRQTVRERIFTQVGDRRTAGLVAAWVVGDQGAIELEADIKVENWASL